MSDDEPRDSFEDSLRAMAQNLGDSLRRLAAQDFDFVAGQDVTGLDPEETKRWARDWVQSHRGAPAGPPPTDR